MPSAVLRLLVSIPVCALVLVTPLLVSADISNPVAHWTFDEASGTTAADSSGNGNTATLTNGATWSTGKIGGAVSFDGVNDYISGPDSNSLDIGNTFTQAFWVKRVGGIGVRQAFMSKGYHTSVPIFETNNLLTWCFSSLGCPFSSAAAITDANFHHLAFVKNGATASIYIDGQLSNSISNAPTTENSTYGLCIGSDNTAGSCSSLFFSGAIDDVYIYNRALSASDVTELYQLGTPTGDTTAPSTPANLTASAASASQINLSWSASTDNVGVTGYQVFRNGTLVGSPSTNSYSDTGLSASTAYSYTVKARDAAGNTSANSNTVSATTQAGGTGGTPTVTLTANPTTVTQGQSTTLTWSSTNATSCALSGGYSATVGTSGTQVVTPGANNTSYTITCTGTGGSATQTVWIPWGTSADTTAPSTPANLTASAASASQINLSWSASTDNVGVTGYQVFRNGTLVGSPSTNSFSDTGLSASTAYSYTVKARDAAGNTSASSNTASATTQAGSTTPPPTTTSGTISVGDRIQVSSGPLNVRSTASPTGGLVGTIPAGQNGTVVSGPITNGGYTWWQIDFDWTYPDGWVAQDFIVSIATNPYANCVSLSLDCAVWQASGIDTKVYPVGVPTGYSWYKDGDQNWGFKPAPFGMTAVTGWSHLYPQSGTTIVPATIYARNMRTYAHLINGGWQLIQDQNNATHKVGGGNFVADLSGNSGFPLTITNGTGFVSFASPVSGRMDHWWIDPRGTYTANTVDGVFVIVEVRVDNPNAQYIMQTGADWWKDAGAPYVNPVGTNNPAVGIGSWTKLTTNFQYSYFTNIPRSVLQADPPPPLIGAPTTPPPTSSAPTVSISTSPSSITSGQSSTLSWSSTNATSCTASSGWSGTKSTSGTQAVTPTTNTTYTLTCTGSGGSTNGSATVTVTTTPPPTGGTPTVTLTANPTTVTQGQSTTLTWSSTNATSCALSGGYSATVGTSGTQVVTPGANNTSYTITCTGTGGSATQTVWIPWGTSADTTAPTVSITAPTNGSTITPGTTVTISADASDNVGVTAVDFKVDGTTIFTDTASPFATNWSGFGLGTHTLTATARDAAGNTTTSNAVIVQTPSTGGTPTVTITASPASIPQGGSSTLTWSSTNATSCALSGGYSATVGTSGTQVVTPGVSNTSYTITCTGTGGSASQTVFIPFTGGTTPPSTSGSCGALSIDCVVWQNSGLDTGVYPAGIPSAFTWYSGGSNGGQPYGYRLAPSGFTSLTGYGHAYPQLNMPNPAAKI